MRGELTNGFLKRQERGIYAASACDFPTRPHTNRTRRSLPAVKRPESHAPGFTLIELILVMAILTVAVSITAPALSNFFHGRTLDSEARRMLALTRQGQ